MSFELLPSPAGSQSQAICCDERIVGYVAPTRQGVVLRLEGRSSENVGRICLSSGIKRLEEIVRARLSR